MPAIRQTDDTVADGGSVEVTTLQSLLEAADLDMAHTPQEDLPWQPGYGLQIVGRGGMRNLERRRVSIVPGKYSSLRTGNQDVGIAGNCSITVDEQMMVAVGDNRPDGFPQEAGIAGTRWGREELAVDGDASISADQRLIMMSGTIDQSWEGSVTRLVGMEGVICGGAFVRTYAGVAATMASMVTGDVFGGCARASAARMHGAIMNFRSWEGASVWGIGCYVRKCTAVVEPAVGSVSQDASTKSRAAKLMKLATNVCPFVGILMAPFAIVFGILGLIRSIKAKSLLKIPPPAGPPRVLTRTTGVTTRSAASELTV